MKIRFISNIYTRFLTKLILSLIISPIYSQSLFLSGTNPQGIIIGDLDVPGNQLTVEAIAAWRGGGNIVSKHNNPGNVNYLLRAGRFVLTTYVSGNSGPSQFISIEYDSISPFTYYHFAATYDGSFVRYYVDGCMVIERPFSGNMYQNNTPAVIGNKYDNFLEQWIGHIDEVRIWNVCRSPEQIKANMNNLPNPQNQAGLLAYYKFNNNLLNSAGSNQWNGTAVGNIAYTDQDVPYEPFQINSVIANNASCSDTEDGSLAVYTNVPNCSYSIDGSDFQQSNEFGNLLPGTYQLSVRTPRGCIENQTVVIGYDRNYQEVAQNISICEGSEYLGYQETGTYIDTIYAANACDTIRTIYLSVESNPPTTDNLVLCPSQVIDYGGLSISSPGSYQVVLQDATGCDSTVVLNVTYAQSQFLQDELHICDGEEIILKSSSETTTWSNNTVSASLVVTKPGIYVGTFIDENGCTIQDSVNVFFHNQIYIPNAFSPNGDGTNDCFRVYFDQYQITDFQISVYNRAGGLVYQSSDPNHCWDGKMNGKESAQGVYAYYLSWRSNTCSEVVRKGSITIVR
jgi:gliding motility-associated-like protein